jgi:hypothetical protein
LAAGRALVEAPPVLSASKTFAAVGEANMMLKVAATAGRDPIEALPELGVSDVPEDLAVSAEGSKNILVFQPGMEAGITVDPGTMTVSSVAGQAAGLGVKAGWRISHLNDKQFSHEFLYALIHGAENYTVSFEAQETVLTEFTSSVGTSDEAPSVLAVGSCVAAAAAAKAHQSGAHVAWAAGAALAEVSPVLNLREVASAIGPVDPPPATETSDATPYKNITDVFHNEEFIMEVPENCGILKIRVSDRDTDWASMFTMSPRDDSVDDYMGEVNIFLNRLADSCPKDRWYDINSVKPTAGGRIRLWIQYIPDGVMRCMRCKAMLTESELEGMLAADAFDKGADEVAAVWEQFNRDFRAPDDMACGLSHRGNSCNARNSFWTGWANRREYRCNECSDKHWRANLIRDCDWAYAKFQSTYEDVT